MSLPRPLLVQVPYSPWSLRARIAMALSGIPHDLHDYIAGLHEPWLRWRLRRLLGRVTVPVLLVEDQAVTDSFDIARGVLSDTALWPEDQALSAWNAWSERMLLLGRIRTTRSVLRDPQALRAFLPPPLDRMPLLGGPIARLGAWYLLRKYPVSENDDEIVNQQGALLDQLEGVLSDQPFLLGELTYADITAASALCFVKPPADLPVPEPARTHWTVPSLVERHTELFAWRDRILAECAARARNDAD